jgi:hypothetical protein
MLRVSYSQQVVLNNNQLKAAVEKCDNNGGSRGNSGGGDGFDIGSSNNKCSGDSNGDSNVDGDSSSNDHTESIMLSVGGAESIILSAPFLKS